MGSSDPATDPFRALYERRTDRVAVNANVALRRFGQNTYQVRVYDASPLGCKLEFVEAPSLEEHVWVKFDGLEPIEGVVCWIEDHVAGIDFVRPLYPAVFEALVERLR